MSSKGKGKTLQGLSCGRKDLYFFEPEQIIVDRSFNLRFDTPENKEHIKRLAGQILSAGKVLQPITVRLEDGKIHLTDGFCRVEAVKMLKKQGKKIEPIPARGEEKNAKPEDFIVTMFVRNSGKPLSFIEQAHGVKRLFDMGMKKDMIADRIGRSITHIDNCLIVMHSSKAIIDCLIKDRISVRRVIEIIREKGESAEVHIKEEIFQAKEAGKQKATGRTAKKSAKKKQPAKQAGSSTPSGSESAPPAPQGKDQALGSDDPGEKENKIAYHRHGQSVFNFFGRLFEAFENEDTVPDSIADIIVDARNYFEDNDIDVCSLVTE